MKKFINVWIIFFLSSISLLAQSSVNVKEGFFVNVVAGVKHQPVNIPGRYLVQEITTESGTTKLVDLSEHRLNQPENYLVGYIMFKVGYHISGWRLGVGTEFSNSFRFYDYGYSLSDPEIPCDGGKDCGIIFLRNQISPSFSINANYDIFHDLNCGISVSFPGVILSKGYNQQTNDEEIYNEIGSAVEFNLEYLLFTADKATDVILIAGAGIGRSQEITFWYGRLGIGIFAIPPK